MKPEIFAVDIVPHRHGGDTVMTLPHQVGVSAIALPRIQVQVNTGQRLYVQTNITPRIFVTTTFL